MRFNGVDPAPELVSRLIDQRFSREGRASFGCALDGSFLPGQPRSLVLWRCRLPFLPSPGHCTSGGTAFRLACVAHGGYHSRSNANHAERQPQRALLLGQRSGPSLAAALSVCERSPGSTKPVAGALRVVNAAENNAMNLTNRGVPGIEERRPSGEPVLAEVGPPVTLSLGLAGYCGVRRTAWSN